MQRDVTASSFEGKSHDVIETGYHIDTPPEKRKVKKYAKSELRLIETLEGVCNRLLEYRIHKERTDSTRFARGQFPSTNTSE